MNIASNVTLVRVSMVWLLAVAMAVMLVVSNIAPATAQSTATVMVSNLEETTEVRQGGRIIVGEGQAYAHSFHTGSTAVTLEKVRLYLRGLGSAPAVTIRADNSGLPGRSLHALTNPTIDSLITTHEDLTTTGYVLAADTTYWLVIHRPWGSKNIRFNVSICDRLLTPEGVTTGEVGWSLGEKLFLGLGSWKEAPMGCRRMLMAVYASAQTTSLNQAANSPATGWPGITGTVRASETLTATTDRIEDEDGLTDAVFAYRWVRQDPATRTDADIEGATSSTYTVTDADEGKAIKVRVTFDDDAGNAESLTSDARLSAPPLVIPNVRPAFPPTETGARTVAENTGADVNIGAQVAATDPDVGDTLTHTLRGTDAASFGIVAETGQLQTKAALDHETKSSYRVTVTATDTSGAFDTIEVTITVTNMNEAPEFVDGPATTRIVNDDAGAGMNIGAPVAARDPDSGDILTYTLGGTNAASFGIVAETGHLQTKATLDHQTKSSYRVTVTATDTSGVSDTIDVTITVTNMNEAPEFADGPATTRIVNDDAGAGMNIGAPVAARDPDSGDTLTYTLGGTDAASFGIVAETGQLQTKAALDHETKSSYRVTVTATDTSGASDTIEVTITVTNMNEAPEFVDGPATTRIVNDDAGAGMNIGAPVAARDPDSGDTLTYTLGGTDAASFGIVAETGRLQTKATLDHETKSSYRVTVTATDTSGVSDTIDVTITVTNMNEAPEFADGPATTRIVNDDAGAGMNIGAPVAASDPDSGDTLTYTLGGTDAASFGIVAATGQLQTKAALDHETKSSYRVTVTATDTSGASDTIEVTITVTNMNEAPEFADGPATTRIVSDDAGAGMNIGAPVAARDPDSGDTLTYTLGGTDAASFGIVAETGRLQTKATLDHQTKSSYRVTVTATDTSGVSDAIYVTITVVDHSPPPPTTKTVVTTGGGGGGGFGPAPVAPKFSDGFRTTRGVAENARAGDGVGEPVAAAHPDDLAITYSLNGADASLFSVDEETGQIMVREGVELALGTTYTVNLTATDSAGFGAIVIVMIEVTEAAFSPYDLNGNDAIERDEVVMAIRDYFSGEITKGDVIELIKLYFAG